jgi:RNA polymerase subunit RPABC4/transcription elongation factor Spt4
MSIRVVCPNGHVLNVKEALAGKTGLCPTCKARVQVPEPSSPAESELNEDAILGIIGPFDPTRAAAEAAPAVVASTVPAKKTCAKCYREILAETHICPYCHYYIADLKDFAT